MNGYKTIVATVGWVLCEGAKPIAPEYEPALVAVQDLVFIPLGVFGLGHKAVKIYRDQQHEKS
jgi:hypothetical protein